MEWTVNQSARQSAVSHSLTTLLLKLGLAFFSVLLVLSCFEVGLRILGYEAIYEIYSKPSALWRSDPDLGWHHEPNSSDVFVGPRPWPVEYETQIRVNSLGLRGPEVQGREEGDVRLLFLGDSMVAALEVAYEKTFPARIGEELALKTGRRVQSINAGVRGYGTDQSYLYFRDRGRLLDPDVVIFFHSHNDLVNNQTIHRMRRAMGKSAFKLRDDGALELVGSPVPQYPACSAYSVDRQGEVARLDGLMSRGMCRAQMLLFDRSALFSFITRRIQWDPDSLRRLYYLAVPRIDSPSAGTEKINHSIKLTLVLLQELKREVEAAGARFLLIGVEDQIAKDLGFAELRAIGITVIPIPRLSKKEDESEFHFLRDSHYNERGHQRVVDTLLPELVRMLREPGFMGATR